MLICLLDYVKWSLGISYLCFNPTSLLNLILRVLSFSLEGFKGLSQVRIVAWFVEFLVASWLYYFRTVIG